MNKKPMTSSVDADSVTYYCPCGESVTGEGEIITTFIKRHKSHTNGECIETITDDGARYISIQDGRERTFKL